MADVVRRLRKGGSRAEPGECKKPEIGNAPSSRRTPNSMQRVGPGGVARS